MNKRNTLSFLIALVFIGPPAGTFLSGVYYAYGAQERLESQLRPIAAITTAAVLVLTFLYVVYRPRVLTIGVGYPGVTFGSTLVVLILIAVLTGFIGGVVGTLLTEFREKSSLD